MTHNLQSACDRNCIILSRSLSVFRPRPLPQKRKKFYSFCITHAVHSVVLQINHRSQMIKCYLFLDYFKVACFAYCTTNRNCFYLLQMCIQNSKERSIKYILIYTLILYDNLTIRTVMELQCLTTHGLLGLAKI